MATILAPTPRVFATQEEPFRPLRRLHAASRLRTLLLSDAGLRNGNQRTQRQDVHDPLGHVEVTAVPQWWRVSPGMETLSPSLWASVRMVIPATIGSALLGAVNGYLLSKWKFRGSDVIFTLILFGMFIPVSGGPYSADPNTRCDRNLWELAGIGFCPYHLRYSYHVIDLP